MYETSLQQICFKSTKNCSLSYLWFISIHLDVYYTFRLQKYSSYLILFDFCLLLLKICLGRRQERERFWWLKIFYSIFNFGFGIRLKIISVLTLTTVTHLSCSWKFSLTFLPSTSPYFVYLNCSKYRGWCLKTLSLRYLHRKKSHELTSETLERYLIRKHSSLCICVLLE